MFRQPFVINDLEPVSLDERSLENALKTLQAAIAKAATLLAVGMLEKAPDGAEGFSSKPRLAHIYTGGSGIALMFLRLSAQYDAAGLDPFLSSAILHEIPAIISRLLASADIRLDGLRHGHLSPLDTPSGPALMHILASLSYPSAGLLAERNAWDGSVKVLRRARRLATEDNLLGGDEVLYGRAGMLWALLNLRVWLKPDARGVDGDRRAGLEKIIGESIEVLVEKLLMNGKTGALLYENINGNHGTSLPLMWEWHTKYYLGAIHGIAGILTVVLQAPRSIVLPHLPTILPCISVLCSLAKKNGGHLPSSLPERQKDYHLVQICHGAPGLLLLLATIRSRFPEVWVSEWEEAEGMACRRVWQDGLNKKGLGVCHGISGNAWSLLLLGITRSGSKEGDIAMGQALAMLVHATRLPPLDSSLESTYRTPDHSASLFEGLAGAVVGWLDACVAIRGLLRDRDRSSVSPSSRKMSGIFGVPGLGGLGAYGFL